VIEKKIAVTIWLVRDCKKGEEKNNNKNQLYYYNCYTPSPQWKKTLWVMVPVKRMFADEISCERAEAA
jgi:hypothetical protein